MDMKINSQLVKKLREERAWSQEQLAQIAGISLRTVQRAEREAGPSDASYETRMALAGAFGVPVGKLSLPEAEYELLPETKTSLTKRRWGVFLLVCSALLLFNFMQSGAIAWAKWPVIVWGLILLFRSIRSRFAK